MHASAQQVDLSLALSGMLTTDAEVRTRIERDGRTVLVMRLELEHQHNTKVQHIVVERTFNAMQHSQAHQTAKQFKRGRCVTFESSTDDVRILFPNVTAINIL